MSRVGAVILAAGESARLGRPKQLIEIDGVPLLRRAVQSAIDAGCQPVVVVLGAMAEPCRELLHDLAAQIVVNAKWRDGMSTSIDAGVDAMQEHDVNAVLLMVCDQPKVDAASLRRLVAAFPGRGLVAARYGGTLGTPAIFAAEHFAALRALSGDRGAKSLIKRNVDDVVTVDLPEAAVDIDTLTDVAGG